LGSDKQEDMPDVPEVKEAECPHTALAPHWQEPADMGKPELTTYACESCGQTFNYADAQQFVNQPPAVLASVGRTPQPYDDEQSR
jgi:hypothetical protein